MKNGWIFIVGILAFVGMLLPDKKPLPALKPVTTTQVSLPPPAILETAPPVAVPPTLPKVEAPKPTLQLRYVRGKRVALRDIPDAKGKVLDRLNNGFEVYEEGRQAGFVKVRHSITQQVGWVQSDRISAEPPKEPPLEEKPSTNEVLTKAAIVALLIERSVAEYRETRPCACPYNTDRSGRACGKRSAWSKPGGAKPLCYAGDVTEGMVAGFRR